VTELFNTLWQLVLNLRDLSGELIVLGLRYWLVLFWLAWSLWGINWQKCWPTLKAGAWAPVVLCLVVVALIWSQVEPYPCECLKLASVPNFWWQLGAVGLIASITLFCGWLQGYLGWTPAEISLDPPAHGHDHEHGHDHGHESTPSAGGHGH